jgi:chromosome segregation and condensation protein ScpB
MINIFGKKEIEEIKKEIEEIKKQNDTRDLILIEKFKQVENLTTTLIQNFYNNLNKNLKELTDKKIEEFNSKIGIKFEEFNSSIDKYSFYCVENANDIFSVIRDLKAEIEEVKNKTIELNKVNKILEEKISNKNAEILRRKRAMEKLKKELEELKGETKNG